MPKDKEPEIDTTPQFCTAKQAASILNISRQAVYDLLRQGKIPSELFGTRRRIKIVDLDAYIAVAGDTDYKPNRDYNKALREAGGASVLSHPSVPESG